MYLYRFRRPELRVRLPLLSATQAAVDAALAPMSDNPTLTRQGRHCLRTALPRCPQKGVVAWSNAVATAPIAHVAAEMGISRACASKWVNRYRRYGEVGLLDRPPGRASYHRDRLHGTAPELASQG